ncbi:hypothetical protein [Lucifera butyrica]|uniref:hypothetical protein n=1 Tax=Lucifera butyrica TaxID=1351585 RepID=UPI000F034E05|nr:hypothetical protein [Lucifera butyrica]
MANSTQGGAKTVKSGQFARTPENYGQHIVAIAKKQLCFKLWTDEVNPVVGSSKKLVFWGLPNGLFLLALILYSGIYKEINSKKKCKLI